MKFEEHMQECRDKLGRGDKEEVIYREINYRIDQFAHYPNMDFLEVHRMFLHHEEGIRYFGRRYGKLGEEAARLHVKSDCGHIPKMADYHNGVVDSYGQLNVKVRAKVWGREDVEKK